MKILGIDSSSLVAGVALVEDDILIAEYTTNFKKTHSQTLLPMIDEITRMTETDLSTIDAIAVTGGPGSFTGLRIGSATAKGLGFALKKPIVNVKTLDAMAYNLYDSSRWICPIMDARRNQVYTGIFCFQNGEMKTILPQCAIALEELLDQLTDLEKEEKKGIAFLGDGVPVYRDKINAYMNDKLGYEPQYVGAHLNRQKAGSVAALAVEFMKTGKESNSCHLETAEEHKPDYLRLSQAEREKKEREKRNNEMS